MNIHIYPSIRIPILNRILQKKKSLVGFHSAAKVTTRWINTLKPVVVCAALCLLVLGCTSTSQLNQSLQAGKGDRSQFRKVGVIIVDMQDELLKNISPKELKQQILNQLDVLNFCSQNEIPVFVLEYTGWGSTTSVLKSRIDSLENKIYISKVFDDGFDGTCLENELKKQEVSTVLLMGINASFCVRVTAQGALNRGYKIMTAGNLIANPDKIQNIAFDTDIKYFLKSYYQPVDSLRGQDLSKIVEWCINTKNADWYESIGTYRNNHRDLLKLLTKDIEKRRKTTLVD
jgi:isochorismate hydrolase